MKGRSLKSLLFGLLAAFGVSAASAGTVASQFFPGFQQLSDNSAEALVNADGSLCAPGGDCLLQQGDRLVGIFTIETIEKAGNPTRFLGGASGNNELTGVFDLTVTSAINFNGGSCLSAWCFTFAASSGDGTAVWLYEDAANDFARTDDGTGTKLARLIASLDTADGGALWATLGLHDAASWYATAVTNDISVVGAVPAPGNGGTFNAALDLIINNSGLEFLTVPCLNATGAVVQVNACGSGSLLGTGGVTTAWDSFDNVDFTVNIRVPEPGSLALLGLGLLGLVGVRRRASK